MNATADEVLRDLRLRRAEIDDAAVGLDELLIACAKRCRITVGHLLAQLLLDFARDASTGAQAEAIALARTQMQTAIATHARPGLLLDTQRAAKCGQAVLQSVADCYSCSPAELLARVLRRWTVMQGTASTSYADRMLSAVVALEELAIEAERTPTQPRRVSSPPPPNAPTPVGEEFARARARHAAGGR